MNNENLESQEASIRLQDIFRLLRSNWLLIVILTLLTTVSAGFYSFKMIPDQFKSSSEIMVFMYANNANSDPDNPVYDLNNSRLIIDTTIGFIKSDYVINKVRSQANFEIPSTLKNSDIVKDISVTSSNASFIIKVSYSNIDPSLAQNMTDLLTTVTVNILSEDFYGSFIKLTDASTPEDDSPNKLIYTIVGMMAGLFLSSAIIFIKYIIHNAYMTKEDLEKGTGLQVLGVIPEFQIKERK